ncbi:cytosolic regulator pianissimo [Lineolata rhizophorae]|uniref:Cytosolic regulator pianissimo n=1 Tax=Lineolata rhizophorae TaxID=578093 RepID=A0A6A6P1B0_9PEZI|nr:cytosolic regulator pianissimo [Lineolata rhizophorae]
MAPSGRANPPHRRSMSGHLPPSRAGKDARSLSAASATSALGARSAVGAASYAPSTAGPPPGSFSSELRSTSGRSETPRPEFTRNTSFGEDEARTASEQRQAEFRDAIEKEIKIKIGSENMLEALNSKNAKLARDQRLRVEQELNDSNRRLAELKLHLEEEIQQSKETAAPAEGGGRLSFLFKNAPARSQSQQGLEDEEPETESPTFVLSEILQALEADDMPPDYYVERSNHLVELFKRHPTLKYDLVWSIFGLRVQTMLLSDSREVVAAGYRVMRYAITDRKSLQTIRSLNTDYLVILSLVKEGKTSIEREQAVKFVRAFLDVKDGVKELSRSVMRILVAVAEHSDDRLKSICILTLAEILIRDPTPVVDAGGVGILADGLGDGNYHASESLTAAFLYLLDLPSRRKFLSCGHELEIPFASFTDASGLHAHEEKLKANAKVIACLLRSWPGLITLSMNNMVPIRSLVSSLYISSVPVRNVLLELLFDLLRIKPPSWSSSFLAGRRLTTYGRVTNLKQQSLSNAPSTDLYDEMSKRNLVDHYVAAVLALLLHCGLREALLHAEEEPLSLTLKRKTTLLLGEVLTMANEFLPSEWGSKLQVLPELVRSAAGTDMDERAIAVGTIYQMDSVNRTLYRSGPGPSHGMKSGLGETEKSQRPVEPSKAQASIQMDEGQFRTQMIDTGVLNTVNYLKWRWDLIMSIIEGPLLNPKRLDEAIKATKFVHRVLGFYRPFKYRFPEIKNTKPNQRYVRAGCALVRSLLQNPEGVKYLAESKLIRQLAECLSHVDRSSGLTSEAPLFTRQPMTETLSGGYFAILGAMSSEPRGMQILERWKVTNMFYHIIELQDRDDLIKTLLSSVDYTLDSHLRILIMKAMTTCSKEVRILATRLLRKYATKSLLGPDSQYGVAEWAIRLLVMQLYDPEIEVCEVAVKILEEACSQKESLEFVVKLRPALDHLGEIGAPLLLRFLSTSVGYHYLDGLDYISKEMDDWFLGRNDTYVALVEASLARALSDIPEKLQNPPSLDESHEHLEWGVVPPHFYRELTRTDEGCKLLEQKGHFDEFVATICDLGMEAEDAETILKVKGCLWAVGNVGSMELGAPFLEKSEVTKQIVMIAEQSEVMTLRGTAFFVLGLISRSLHGQEILTEFGWDGMVNANGQSLGYCMPLDFQKLFTIKPWKRVTPQMDPIRGKLEVKAITADGDPVNARILQLITNLSNAVLTSKATNELLAIKAKKPPGFRKPALFHKVMSILEAHHFRLQAYRYVINLFDRKVLRQILLEEDEDEDEDEEADEGRPAVNGDVARMNGLQIDPVGA